MSSGGDGIRAKHRIRCGGPVEAPDGSLVFEIDGRPHRARLRIEQLYQRLVAGISDRALDLLEIAAYVYAADSALPRGGLSDPGLGARWRRHLRFEIPVRDAVHWRRPGVLGPLTETLGLLSDDLYSFSFLEQERPPASGDYFDFGQDEGFMPDQVLLFSGGLDSLAGALDEVVNRKGRVVLVSHQSATKLQKVQRDLADGLRNKAGKDRIFHVPVTMHLLDRGNRESTHRSRSFFFAALSATVARAFGQNRVRFHENGIVSMNLPISGQVMGARATRSTHPQVLAGLSALLTALFEEDFHVDNPFVWKTKTEILAVIQHLGAKDLIPRTRSCGEVRQSTTMHPHCGLCSQCIDRRFGALAAGLEDSDPLAGYSVDPLSGPRVKGPDREMALGYVNNARRFASMSPTNFTTAFGEIQRVIGFLDEPAHAAVERTFRLHQRHGQAVTEVLNKEFALISSGGGGGRHHPDSLVMLAGQALFRMTPASVSVPIAAKPNETWQLVLDGPVVCIKGLGAVRGAEARLLTALAELHLEAIGQGKAPEDHPALAAGVLADRWDVNEETVRQQIRRLRKTLEKRALEAGLDQPGKDDIVENIPWQGYRLNPDRVQVRRTASSSD
ncbi:MAG: helix-turn-helix domain-containing protein [Kiloniellales bacterium]